MSQRKQAQSDAGATTADVDVRDWDNQAALLWPRLDMDSEAVAEWSHNWSGQIVSVRDKGGCYRVDASHGDLVFEFDASFDTPAAAIWFARGIMESHYRGDVLAAVPERSMRA
jgi:hypothetical protein